MQFFDLAQQSLVKSSSSVVEEYIPLWVLDGNHISSGLTTSPSLIANGTTSNGYSASSVNVVLYTLNTNWNSNQTYAFEATMYSGISSDSVTAELWDLTANIRVTNSVISTSSTTAIVIRSGVFTLIPGHSYGVSFYIGTSSDTAYFIGASLIVFG